MSRAIGFRRATDDIKVTRAGWGSRGEGAVQHRSTTTGVYFTGSAKLNLIVRTGASVIPLNPPFVEWGYKQRAGPALYAQSFGRLPISVRHVGHRDSSMSLQHGPVRL